ncbi:MAG: hypothetical protein IPK20_20215 [Betaproteobacteria bacterium]|nr:hypothetical protein [Betaproteobacteria bacterium]
MANPRRDISRARGACQGFREAFCQSGIGKTRGNGDDIIGDQTFDMATDMATVTEEAPSKLEGRLRDREDRWSVAVQRTRPQETLRMSFLLRCGQRRHRGACHREMRTGISNVRLHRLALQFCCDAMVSALSS